MKIVKSDRSGLDMSSTFATIQQRERMRGRRFLERMGLMTVDQPPRNPYWDLDILGLMSLPSPRRPKTDSPRNEQRNDFDVDERPSWTEENPRSSWDREPLLL